MVTLTCFGNCSKWHHEGLCITVCHSNRVSVERTPTAKETIHYIVHRSERQARIFTLANQKQVSEVLVCICVHHNGLFSFQGSSQIQNRCNLMVKSYPSTITKKLKTRGAQCELECTRKPVHARYCAPTQVTMIESLL